MGDSNSNLDNNLNALIMECSNCINNSHDIINIRKEMRHSEDLKNDASIIQSLTTQVINLGKQNETTTKVVDTHRQHLIALE